jgi:hypothetical protein
MTEDPLKKGKCTPLDFNDPHQFCQVPATKFHKATEMENVKDTLKKGLEKVTKQDKERTFLRILLYSPGSP